MLPSPSEPDRIAAEACQLGTPPSILSPRLHCIAVAQLSRSPRQKGLPIGRQHDGSGRELRRCCYNARGQSWEEGCTLWEEGRRYRMEVDTTSYPAPLRQLLRSFSGTWSVEPTAGGCRVLVAFDAEPASARSAARRCVSWAGAPAASSRGILDTYERAATRRASARAA